MGRKQRGTGELQEGLRREGAQPSAECGMGVYRTCYQAWSSGARSGLEMGVGAIR